MKNLKFLAATLNLLAGVLTTSVAAAADDYPNQPIRLIVPFSPGGTSDNLARGLAKDMGKRLGQAVIVENKPGAGTAIGSQQVARSAPDGYVLLWITPPFAINETLMKNTLAYDARKDFTAVADVGATPLILVVNSDSKITTFKQLVELAKKSADKPLTYGTSGLGGSPHLSTVMFAKAADVKLTHIPYRGSSLAGTALLANEVDLIFDTPLLTLPHVQAGKFTALAQTGVERSPQFPDTPTMRELGLKDYEAGSWFSVLAPAGTPKPIIDKLNKTIREVQADKTFQDTFRKQGVVMTPNTPEGAQRRIMNEIERWGQAVRDSGATVN